MDQNETQNTQDTQEDREESQVESQPEIHAEEESQAEDEYARFADERGEMNDDYYTYEEKNNARGKDVLKAKLIDRVRENPTLYDKSRYVFRKTKVQNELWMKIGEELGIPREYFLPFCLADIMFGRNFFNIHPTGLKVCST